MRIPCIDDRSKGHVEYKNARAGILLEETACQEEKNTARDAIEQSKVVGHQLPVLRSDGPKAV
jgi:hypothetical protein